MWGSELGVRNGAMIAAAGGHELARTYNRLSDCLNWRPQTPADEDFLLSLFAESRPELALVPEAVRSQLIRMQFEAQRSQYRGMAPDAVDWILKVDHGGRTESVGRCYLWQRPHEHRLLDLAIGCQWRRQGLASCVLERLCVAAAHAGVPLRLSVWQANPDALRLYRRHGFVAEDAGIDHDGAGSDPAGYLRLRWSAEGQQ